MQSSPQLSALESDIRGRIAREAPAEISVALNDLGGGERLFIDADRTMHAASTMKVPVLIEVYRQAAHHRFSLGDSIVVKNSFTSIADGSAYTLSPDDDSEFELYRVVGRKTTIRELARLMIVRSSNVATNILVELVTPDSIQHTMHGIGADGARVLRGVEDGPAFKKGLNNTMTAAALARVLEAIARCEVTDALSCREMTDILARQEFNDMIPAGLPPGTRVAHKTGWITKIQHDGAIVFPAGRAPYVLAVLTRGIADTLVAARAGADISRMVWQRLGTR